MKKDLVLISKKSIIIFIFMLVILLIFSTYASKPELFSRSVVGKILRIDEEAYGNLNFDSSNLSFSPIIDSNVQNNNNNVIHIDFKIGGSKYNNIDNIIYHISLTDLVVDCSLLTEYLKWKLLKNGEVISEGSLDYKFDTIENGRLVLTPIQQDLKEYNEDKTTYDKYDFYMWLSDSCQSQDIRQCLKAEDQSNLLNKKISGKIQVELYAETKQELIRKPSNILNTESCVVGSGDEVYVNG